MNDRFKIIIMSVVNLDLVNAHCVAYMGMTYLLLVDRYMIVSVSMIVSMRMAMSMMMMSACCVHSEQVDG